MTNNEIVQQIQFKLETIHHMASEIEALAGMLKTPASSENPTTDSVWTSTTTEPAPVPDPVVTPPTSETADPPATE